MSIKPVIESGWNENGSLEENNASAAGLVFQSCSFLKPPACSIMSTCGIPPGCSGGGLSGPACSGGSPVGCNMPTSDPGDQS